MITAGTGSVAGVTAWEAGHTIATAARRTADNPKLAFLYTSVDHDIADVLAGAVAELPGVPIIGNTSFTGVIGPNGFTGGDDGFAGMLLLGGDLDVGVAGAPLGDDPRATGRAVAQAALAAAGRELAADGRPASAVPDIIHMVANPAQEEYLLKGIADVVGRVPVFGGSAADNTIGGLWSLYCVPTTGETDGVWGEGVAVAFIWTDAPVANVFTGAYRETSDVGIVTAVNGDRSLAAIDGVLALTRYAQWRDVDESSLLGGNLLVETIHSPLGVKDRLGDLVAIRHPMNGNDDHSMALGSKVVPNTAVIRMEASTDELIESVTTTLAELIRRTGGSAAAYHLVHCGGRRAGIADRIDEVSDRIRELVGDVPFICEFTFGEYGWADDGANTCGGLMLSFTAIGTSA